MAKSLRSKTKRAHRASKRVKGDYAVADAARLFRLNQKLRTVATTSPTGATPADDENLGDVDQSMSGSEDVPKDQIDHPDESCQPTDSMNVDSSQSSTRISTHGPRSSRREQWRLSKGLSAFPKAKGMNNQGGLAAKRKPGRSKRRR